MIQNILFGIATIAVIVLAYGGITKIVSGANRNQGILMLIAALVVLGNVLIWTIPV